MDYGEIHTLAETYASFSIPYLRLMPAGSQPAAHRPLSAGCHSSQNAEKPARRGPGVSAKCGGRERWGAGTLEGVVH